MFSFFKKLFKPRPQQPRLTLPGHAKPEPAPKAVEKPGAAAPAKAKDQRAKLAAQRINPGATPEQLCGIEPGMTKEEISDRLALLYRRHNRAASSLEANLREEAEVMLDIIAAMRQKHLG